MRDGRSLSIAALCCSAMLLAAAQTYAADDDKKPADTKTVTLKVTGMT